MKNMISSNPGYVIQEAFVTPGDLLSNTTNLMDMGLLTYTAEELARYLNENDPAGC